MSEKCSNEEGSAQKSSVIEQKRGVREHTTRATHGVYTASSRAGRLFSSGVTLEPCENCRILVSFGQCL